MRTMRVLLFGAAVFCFLLQGRSLSRAFASPPATSSPADDTKVLLDDRIDRWGYRLFIEHASSRSGWTVGELTFDGKPIPAEGNGAFMWTPWGKLVYISKEPYHRGWLPPRHTQYPKGDELAGPDRDACRIVRDRCEQLTKAGGKFGLTLTYRDGKTRGQLFIGGPRLAEVPVPWKEWDVRIPPAVVPAVVESVAAEGWLAKALDPRMIREGVKPPDAPISVSITDGGELHLFLFPPITSQTVGQLSRVLETTRNVDDEKARAQASEVLSALSEFVKRNAPASRPAP